MIGYANFFIRNHFNFYLLVKSKSLLPILAFLLILVSNTITSAQSTISPTDNHAYSANAGWIDFRPSAADGVKVTETYLSGKAYAANLGWIDLGDGSPDNGYSYTNLTATDYGVNMDPGGNLSGYAYSANVGWIKFSLTGGQSKLDFSTGTITGFAYAANIGWITLDSPSAHLATAIIACPDTDADGIADAFEMLYFHDLFTATSNSDYDHDGKSDLAESIANTDPKDPQSRLQIINQTYDAAETLGDRNLILMFRSSPNRLYTIQQSTDLSNWSDSGLGLFPGHPSGLSAPGFDFTDGPRRFFRVAAHKPLP